MPSVGSIPPVSSLDEDITAVRTVVIKELDQGQNVVVNAHSKFNLLRSRESLGLRCLGSLSALKVNATQAGAG